MSNLEIIVGMICITLITLFGMYFLFGRKKPINLNLYVFDDISFTENELLELARLVEDDIEYRVIDNKNTSGTAIILSKLNSILEYRK